MHNLSQSIVLIFSLVQLSSRHSPSWLAISIYSSRISRQVLSVSVPQMFLLMEVCDIFSSENAGNLKKDDVAVIQTVNQSFDFNGESDLDLEYAMGLTNPQKITLLQTGDLVEG